MSIGNKLAASKLHLAAGFLTWFAARLYFALAAARRAFDKVPREMRAANHVRKPAARWSLLAASLLPMLMLFGCGGGASSYTPPPPPPPPPPALTIKTQSPLPRAVLGQPYTAKLQATGGVPPYTWSTQLLGIPGMTLASDGMLSGTPAQQATFIPNF